MRTLPPMLAMIRHEFGAMTVTVSQDGNGVGVWRRSVTRAREGGTFY